MTDPVYTLTLSSSQAKLIARALDFWMRVHGGQMWALREVGWRQLPKGHRLDVEALDAAIADFKKAAFPEMYPHDGKFDFPGGREAFNLRKVIEHGVSWHEQPLAPGSLLTVNYDGPLEDWWETSFRATMQAQEPDHD